MIRKNFSAGKAGLRFLYLSVIIIFLLSAFPDRILIRFLCLLTAAVTFLTATRSGLSLTGRWLRKEHLRSIPAPQNTLLFRKITAIPLALVLLYMERMGYQMQISTALVNFFFPAGETEMMQLHLLAAKYFPPVTGAVFVYSAFMLLCGCLIVSRQIAVTRRMLSEMKYSGNARKVLNDMSWDQFEKLICQFFALQGYKSSLTKQGADGGEDIVLHGRHGKEIVQCKHWKKETVGVAVVREIFGVIQAENYYRGFIVISGKFSDEAWMFVKKAKVKGKLVLIDGDLLVKMINKNKKI